jgi:hypothetical protein
MAYFDQTTPEFPICSWQISLPLTAVTVENVGTGISFIRNIPAGDYWGYNPVWNGIESVANPIDSLIGILAQTVEDILNLDFADPGLPQLVGKQNWVVNPGSTYLRPRIEVAAGFTSADYLVTVPVPEVFGFSPTGETLVQLTGLLNATYNSSGYFSPYNETVLDDRKNTREIYQRESSFAAPISTNIWGVTKTRRVLSWPFVYAAYVYRYRRVLPVFADAAKVLSDDPNNLLENWIEGVADGRVTRVFQDEASAASIAGEYRFGVVVGDPLRDTSAALEDVSGNGQIFSTTIEIIDQGTVDAV